MRIAICEDSLGDIRVLRGHLERYLAHHHLQSDISLYDSGEALLSIFAPGKFQIIFLDIYMGRLSGMDTARKIRAVDPDCAIIFTTTSEAHALEGFAVQATHYLVKPMEYRALWEAMERCRGLLEQFARTVEILQNRVPVRIPLRDIRYVEAGRRACTIHTAKKQHTVYLTMDALEKELAGEAFVRCHRSFLVNLRWVKAKSGDFFEMENGGRAYISRRLESKTQQAYDRYIDHLVVGEGTL